MQTLRLIKILVLLAVLSVTAQAQLTNLNTLNGTNMTIGVAGVNDFVLFYKWTGTKYVWNRQQTYDFFSQYTNSPAGQFLFTNLTALQASVSNETVARISGVSNNLVIATNLSNGVNAARLSGETSLTNLINAEVNQRVAATNTLALAMITASNSAAVNITTASNSLAGQIAIVSAAQGLSLTNGASVKFSTVTATNVLNPSIVLPNWNTSQSSSTSNINFALGNNQILTLGTGTGQNILYLLPTNMVDGQTVYLLVRCPSAAYKLYSAAPSGYTLLGGSTLVTAASGSAALLNWMVMSNTIIFSGGAF